MFLKERIPQSEETMKLVQTAVASLSRLKYHKSAGFLMLGVLIALTTGCTQLDPTRTGYLSDYSQLHNKDVRASLIRPRVVESGGSGLEAFGDIDSFLIEPVGWRAGDVAPAPTRRFVRSTYPPSYVKRSSTNWERFVKWSSFPVHTRQPCAQR